jgi:hypothetical protein
VRCGREVFENTSHFDQVIFTIDSQLFAYGVLVTEILFRHGRRHENTAGVLKCRFWIAMDKGHGEDIKEGSVYRDDIRFVIAYVFLKVAEGERFPR